MNSRKRIQVEQTREGTDYQISIEIEGRKVRFEQTTEYRLRYLKKEGQRTYNIGIQCLVKQMSFIVLLTFLYMESITRERNRSVIRCIKNVIIEDYTMLEYFVHINNRIEMFTSLT